MGLPGQPEASERVTPRAEQEDDGRYGSPSSQTTDLLEGTARLAEKSQAWDPGPEVAVGKELELELPWRVTRTQGQASVLKTRWG